MAEGKKMRAVAIESEDTARAIAIVRGLGLSELVNVSYPRGFKEPLGMKD